MTVIIAEAKYIAREYAALHNIQDWQFNIKPRLIPVTDCDIIMIYGWQRVRCTLQIAVLKAALLLARKEVTYV